MLNLNMIQIDSEHKQFQPTQQQDPHSPDSTTITTRTLNLKQL
jgi:hypothetical protein